MSKARTNRQTRPQAEPAASATAAELVQALAIDWSAVDWTRLLLEVGLVAVDWAQRVLVPLLQSAGGPLAPLVSMLLASAKRLIEQQLRDH